MKENLQQSHKALILSTLAFTICFACWTMNGVLVTYLTENGIFNWSVTQTGWLLGIPILTGSVMRLPAGILTDKFGGKKVFVYLLLFCSVPLFLLPFAAGYGTFALLSFLFGLTGTSFAVGVAYTSVWYPKNWQGRALGIFGMGNAGASLTTFLAPSLIRYFSEKDPMNGWKNVPLIYGALLVAIALLFFLFADDKRSETVSRTTGQLLQPLKSLRVWRFGLYYFLVFGCFVAFSQWLLPYYVNVYKTSLVMGGIMASLFSLPSGVIRALGGYLSDKFGARTVMYWVLGSSLILSLMLMVPQMDIYTSGMGVTASKGGTVTEVTEHSVVVDKKIYPVNPAKETDLTGGIFPAKNSWQETVVKVNDQVQKKQLLAKGITKIHFEAHIWVFTVLVVLIGIVWGIGKAAIYKHIPEYFPGEVGVVGGMVGMIGGLGGFICPVLFSYLLTSTGIWTSSWMLMALISAISLIWMHRVIVKMTKEEVPALAKQFERKL
jgi:MFS transporter, NNP family, nitrate/nitrite transporter